jgi:hypothetical protein
MKRWLGLCFLVLCLVAVLGLYVFANMSQWCPTDVCNGNHCYCAEDYYPTPYIEELGTCCFTCWKWYPWGCDTNCWYYEIYTCCGPGGCEPRHP